MEITLIQGILLAIVAFICGIDQCWEAFYWFRPMRSLQVSHSAT